MRRLVAEVLNIPAESVRVVHPDTDVTPYDMATLGSRSTLSTWATRCSSRPRTRATRLEALARELGLPEGTNVPVAELFQKKYKMQAGNIIGTGSYIPNYVPPDHERPDAECHAVLDGRRHAVPRSRSIPRPATCG